MSLSNWAEAELLDLLFLNQAWGEIGDTNGLQPSAVAGNYYLTLHTSSPGEAGNAASNEATYGGYARVLIARGASGWTRTSDVISNTSDIVFPACTSGLETITHWSITTGPSGATNILVFQELNLPRLVQPPDVVRFAAGNLTIIAK